MAQPRRPRTPTILFISHSKEVGGTELYLEGLLRYALRANFRAALVCRRDPLLDAWAGRIASAGVTVHRLDLTAPSDYLTLVRWMRRATLVHLMLAYPVGKYQLVAALLAAVCRTPLVVTHHLLIDLPAIRMSVGRRRFWACAFRQYGRLARWNIAVSRAGRDLLLRYGFPAARTELIYNGVDLTRFAPIDPAQRQRVRAAMAQGGEPWPDDAVIGCTVARLTPQKGLFDLIEAVPAVLARFPACRFVIVGDGELRDAITKRIGEAGLQSQVRLAGSRPREELPALMGAADLFILSSRYEGLPLALLEAMAAGCPVVATEVGGVGEILTDACGVLVPPADPARLAEGIARIVGDAQTRAAMASAARARVMAFSMDACYEKTTLIYAGLVPSAPAPARA